MEPTFEQLATATRIAARSDFSDYHVSFSTYNETTGQHDDRIGHLLLNVNDLWAWACADAEAIRWEHVDLFEQRMAECGEHQEEFMAAVAYAAVVRNEGDPQNWFTHYTRSKDTNRYEPIHPADRDRWEMHTAWWLARIAPPPAAAQGEE